MVPVLVAFSKNLYFGHAVRMEILPNKPSNGLGSTGSPRGEKRSFALNISFTAAG